MRIKPVCEYFWAETTHRCKGGFQTRPYAGAKNANLIQEWFRLALPTVLAFFLIGLPITSSHIRAEEPTATPESSAAPESMVAPELVLTPEGTATSLPVRFFKSRLQVKVLGSEAGPYQDVQGRVINRSGVGIDGIVVRVLSGDLQALETTTDGGIFKFVLTQGTYVLQLVDMISEEVKFTLDGKSEPQVELYEVESLPIPPPRYTATPTATTTTTTTPTATETPKPTSTPAPLPTSISTASVAEPTATATVSALSLPTEIDFEPWLRVFTIGATMGGLLLVVGLAVALVRRS